MELILLVDLLIGVSSKFRVRSLTMQRKWHDLLHE